MEQEFSCNNCGAEGSIHLEDGLEEDAIVAFRKLDAEHQRLSPDCPLANKAKLLEGMIMRGEWPHSQAAGILN